MSAINLTEKIAQKKAFINAVNLASGQDVSKCYQCGKCTAGCPIAFAMDKAPNQVIHMVQMGLEEVLESEAIWLCATCSTCTVRCPRNVDLAKVMDTLRIMAKKKGKVVSSRNVAVFNELFLDSVRKHGRLFEAGLAVGLNLKTGHYLKDAEMGPAMFSKGKLSLTAPKIKGVDEIRRLFDNITKLEGSGQ